jgi:hypothetical protein
MKRYKITQKLKAKNKFLMVVTIKKILKSIKK